jgi:hypothetical protein
MAVCRVKVVIVDSLGMSKNANFSSKHEAQTPLILFWLTLDSETQARVSKEQTKMLPVLPPSLKAGT